MKNAQKRKMQMALARLHLQHFYLTVHLLNASLKRKNRQHFHHPILKRKTDNISIILLLQQRQQEPLVCYSNTHIDYIAHQHRPPIVECNRNAWQPENDEFSWFIVNCNICQQEICKHFRKARLTCRIPATCCSIPMALAPFSAVILRMMMQNIVCLPFYVYASCHHCNYPAATL